MSIYSHIGSNVILLYWVGGLRRELWTGTKSSKAVKVVKKHDYTSTTTRYVKVELPGDKGDLECESIDKGSK